jgi:hypothetical protein
MASVTKRVWVYQGITKSAWAVRYVDGGSRQRQRTFAKKKDADTLPESPRNRAWRPHAPRAVTDCHRGGGDGSMAARL